MRPIGFPLAMAAIGFAAAGGCAPSHARAPLSADVHRPERCAVVLFADGLDLTRMDELYARGELPAIQRRFVEGGVRVRRAVTSLPAVTYPNTVSLITGVFPGHHGVTGNQWFDRRSLRFGDYASAATYRSVNEDFHHATVYEALADHFSVNVQNHTRRGATCTLDNWTASGIDWFLGRYTSVDARVGRCMHKVAAIADAAGRWPLLIMTYFPGVDQTGHKSGVQSRAYAEALRNFDRQVDRITGAIDELGLADRTTFVLVSDHGLVHTGRNRRLDVAKWLRAVRGIKSRNGPARDGFPNLDDTYPAVLRQLNRAQAVVVVNAYRLAAIHLRGQRGWPFPPEPAEVLQFISQPPALFEHPAVELVLCRAGPDQVRLLSHRGRAVVERRAVGAAKEYRVVDAVGDLFGLSDDAPARAFLGAGWHASREWLAATADWRHPDLVAQSVELMDSPRAGDVLLFAADDWSFDRDDASGHGSCVARDMLVPLFFAGPGLPRGAEIPCGRLVDVTPTLLDLLGQSDHAPAMPGLDGVSLCDALRAAGPPAAFNAER